MAGEARPTIAVGADHGGFPLKEELKTFLAGQGYPVTDCGTDSRESVDYPVFAKAVAEKVSQGQARFGIMVDGAGIGSSMTANKVPGVRAALCYDVSTANNAREHNDANVLTLGAGLIGPALARQIVTTFLTVECTADRHKRRVRMIDELDLRPPSTPTLSQSSVPSRGEAAVESFTQDDVVRVARRMMELTAEGAGAGAAADTLQRAVCGSRVCTNCGECAVKAPDDVRRMIDMGAGRISYTPGRGKVPEDIAGFIDHTLLAPNATRDDIVKLCEEARTYKFASVCVNPTYVPLARQQLEGTRVDVCTVIGFPFGTHMSDVKAMETRRAIRDGAREIDMVINVGALKSGDTELVLHDIRAVVEACEDGSALSKVIIETAMLTDDEKRTACELAKQARANFVKTSTGYGGGGATAEDVALMSSVVSGSGMGVKASGGIRDYEAAQKMIKAGATRIGASAGIKIVQGAKQMTVSN